MQPKRNRLRNRHAAPGSDFSLRNQTEISQPLGAGALGFTRMQVATGDEHLPNSALDGEDEYASRACCTPRWVAVFITLCVLVGGVVSVLVLWKGTRDDLTSSSDELGTKIDDSAAAQLKQSAYVNQSLSDSVALLAVHVDRVNATLSREVESVAEEMTTAMIAGIGALREDVRGDMTAMNATVAIQLDSLRAADDATRATIEATERRLVAYTDSKANATEQGLRATLQQMSDAVTSEFESVRDEARNTSEAIVQNITALSSLLAASVADVSSDVTRVQAAVDAQAMRMTESLNGLTTSLTDGYTQAVSQQAQRAQKAVDDLTDQTQTSVGGLHQVTQDLTGTIEALDEDVTQFKDTTAQNFLDVQSSFATVDAKLDDVTNLTISSVAAVRFDLTQGINAAASMVSDQAMALVANEAALRVATDSNLQVAVNSTSASVLDLRGHVEDVSRALTLSIGDLATTVSSNNVTTIQEIRRINSTLVAQSSQITSLGGNVSDLIVMASNSATLQNLQIVSGFVTGVRENVSILFDQSLPRLAQEIDKLNASAQDLGVSLSNLRSDFASLENGTIITTLRAQVASVQASADNKTSSLSANLTALSVSTNVSLASLRTVVDTKAPLNTTQALAQNITTVQWSVTALANLTAVQVTSLQTQVSTVQTQANTLTSRADSLQVQVSARANQSDLVVVQDSVSAITQKRNGSVTKDIQDQLSVLNTSTSSKASQVDLDATRALLNALIAKSPGTVTQDLQTQVGAKAFQADLIALQLLVGNISSKTAGTVTKDLQDQVSARALQTDLVLLQLTVGNISSKTAGTVTKDLQDQVSARANQTDLVSLQNTVTGLTTLATGTVTKSLQDQVSARALQTDLVSLQNIVSGIANMATGTVTKSLQDQLTLDVQAIANLTNKVNGTVTRNLQDQIDTKAPLATVSSLNASVVLITSAFTGKANVADLATLNTSVITLRDLLSNSATLQNLSTVSQFVNSVQANTSAALDAVQRVDTRVTQLNATVIANYTTRTDFLALQNNVAGLANGALLSQVQSNVTLLQAGLASLQSGLVSAQATTASLNSSLTSSLQAGLGAVQVTITSMNSSHQASLAALQATTSSLNSSLQAGLASALAATTSLNSSLTASLQTGLGAAQANLLSVNATLAASLASSVSSIRAQLDNKTDLAIASCMQSQIDSISSTVSALTTSVSSKADNSSLVSLQGSVATLSTSTTAALALKADATVTADLQTQVNAKASTSALTTVQTTLGNKADTTAVNTALAAKADSSTVTALQTTVTGITTKAAGSVTSDLQSQVTAAQTSLSSLLVTLNGQREYTTALVAMMDKFFLSGTTNAVGSLTTPSVTLTASAALTTAMDDSYVYRGDSVDLYDARGDHLLFNVATVRSTWFLRRGNDFANTEGSPSDSTPASMLVITIPGDYRLTLTITSPVATYSNYSNYTGSSTVVLYATPLRFLNGFRGNACRFPGGGASGAGSVPWATTKVLGTATWTGTGSTLVVTGDLKTQDFTASAAYSVQIGAFVTATNGGTACGGYMVCGCAVGPNSFSSSTGSPPTLRIDKKTAPVVPFGNGVSVGRIRVRVFQTPAALPTQLGSDTGAIVTSRVTTYIATAIDLNITAYPDRTAFTFTDPATSDGASSYYYHLAVADPTLADKNNPRYTGSDSTSVYYKQALFAVAGGFLKFPGAGVYNVNVWADDGFYMWIGAKFGVNPSRNAYWTGNPYKGSVSVTINDPSDFWQPFTVYVFNNGGQAFWRIMYQPSGSSTWSDFTSDMIAG